MERQQWLKLESAEERAEALRKYLQPIQLAPRQIAVLCVIAGMGDLIQVGTQHGSRLSLAKSRLASAAKRVGCPAAANTWLAGAAELERRNLVSIVRVTTPWTYFVNWDRIARLEAEATAEPRPEELAVFKPDLATVRSGPVRSGQGAHDSVSIQESKVRVSVVPSVQHGRPVATDRTGRCAAESGPVGCTQAVLKLPRKPWARNGGVSDRDLVQAVITGDLGYLAGWYQEGVRLGWISDVEVNRHRWLVICHHCATDVGLTVSRVGAIVQRVKRGQQSPERWLDAERTRQDSDDWAAALRRDQHRDPALAGERVSRETEYA